MKAQNSKTAAVMNLISRGTAVAAGNEGQVPAVPNERSIEEITQDILHAQQTGGEALLTIGKGLIEAKAKLNHGEWLDWLTERVNYSPRSAQKLMKLAREWTNASTLSHLGASKAFALLVLPEDERDAFITENHLVNGEEKTVIDMSARELKKALRDRADALADKSDAEAARDKMAEDMKIVKQLLETAQEERDTSLREAQERQELLRASELEASRLAQELDELKKRPVEVAVQVDQDALVKAREEGRAKAEAEFKTSRKAAQEQVMKANAEAAQTKTELDQARREIEDLKFELSRAEKPSPLTADTELAQFKLLFDQAQGIVNQMLGLLLKVRAREDGSTAENLEKALRALGEKIGGAAQ